LKCLRPNTLLTHGIRTLFIESWGRGISMIMNACKGVGIPEPVIEELAGGFSNYFLQRYFYQTLFERIGT
jgi:predicted HTH transcriptional regulator